jgi:hypothetical protein
MSDFFQKIEETEAWAGIEAQAAAVIAKRTTEAIAKRKAQAAAKAAKRDPVKVGGSAIHTLSNNKHLGIAWRGGVKINTTSRPIYTLDIETDPFMHERFPRPFLVGVYDGVEYRGFWGVECIAQAKRFLETLEPGLIYIHNGARFDVIGYLIPWILGSEVRMIKETLAVCQMKCSRGFHEIRDSVLLFPFALDEYQGKSRKATIAMWKLEEGSREKHKREIVEYNRGDCLTLHEMINGFVQRYGLETTIARAALKQFEAVHAIEYLGPHLDAKIRRFMIGGRMEFKPGIFRGRYRGYDIRNTYPSLMARFAHPVSGRLIYGRSLDENTDFLTVTGWNYGALATKGQRGEWDFKRGYGIFDCTGHELRTAIRLGRFKLDKVIQSLTFTKRERFERFTEKIFKRAAEAERRGDQLERTVCKFLMNTAAGKCAQNPAAMEETCLTRIEDEPFEAFENGWERRFVSRKGKPKAEQFAVWKRAGSSSKFYHVGLAASVTGAGRAALLEGLHAAQGPVYCQTDSIICESLDMPEDRGEPGDWRLEWEATLVLVAGVNRYAALTDDPAEISRRQARGEQLDFSVPGFACFKIVPAGPEGLTAAEMLDLCEGREVKKLRAAPTMTLTRDVQWLTQHHSPVPQLPQGGTFQRETRKETWEGYALDDDGNLKRREDGTVIGRAAKRGEGSPYGLMDCETCGGIAVFEGFGHVYCEDHRNEFLEQFKAKVEEAEAKKPDLPAKQLDFFR